MDYVEAFENLKANERYARKTPHKAILLLTIIEMYETNEISGNEIRCNQTLVDTFLKVWNRTLPEYTSFYMDAYIPFWTMRNEGFWHFVPVRGKEEVLSFLKENNSRPSENKIRECIDYVELDEDLYFLMTVPSGRSSLKRALLSCYSTLSEKEIETLSESEANDADYSLAALDEYKKMINSKSEQSVALARECSDENAKSRFYGLDEDVQIQLNIDYYTFLRDHKIERRLIKEHFPTVFDLYDKISEHPLEPGEVAASMLSLYEDFLTDMKMNLLGVDDAMEVIDGIENAIAILHRHNPQPCFAEEASDSIILEEEKPEAAENEEDSPSELEMRRKDIPWTENEEELLLLCFDKGRSLGDIAKVLGRPKCSIQQRLAILGKVEYDFESSVSNEVVASEVSEDAATLDYYVENMKTTCCILNRNGERVYSTKGKFKVFHGKLYRFNYKDGICFTVKGMTRTDGVWQKGSKVIVPYCDSDLFPLLDKNHYIEQIEDVREGASMRQNTIRVDGHWYDFDGNMIGVSEEPLGDIMAVDDQKAGHLVCHANGFIPKGGLETITGTLDNLYDYLWLMAIVDIVGDGTHSLQVSFDELACMMIAVGWGLLNRNPRLRDTHETMTEGVEYLMEESKTNMEQVLSWETTPDIVFEEIKDYPMSGKFEDLADELVQDAPTKVLHIWLDDKEEPELVLHSANYVNQCMYSLHLKKFDSYIEVNPAWKRYLIEEHANLHKYIEDACLGTIILHVV